MKRRQFLAAAAAGACLPSLAPAQPRRVVTDATGRRIEVPGRVERIYAAGPPASILVFAVAPDKLIGWTSAWREAERPFIARKYVDLPALGRLTGRGNTANVEVVLREKPDIDVALTVRKSERSPYFTMAHVDPSGRAEIIIKNDPPFHRRQDVPESFDLTTVAYAVRTSLIRTGNGLFDGTVHAVEVPAERAMDIDTPYDFLVAELLAEHWKNAKRET